MDLDKFVLYEYLGTVTQLGATSEVAEIGLLLTVPVGERVKILAGRTTVSDIAAGKTVNVRPTYTGGSTMNEWSNVAHDNDVSFWPALMVNEDASFEASRIGQTVEPILGGGQTIKIHCVTTIDALATIQVFLSYLALVRPMVATAIGAGISISAETHKSV